MNGDFVASLGAGIAVVWSALLALAEGALAAQPRLAESALPPAFADRPDRLRRALSLSRITFLALAAVAVSSAVHWWDKGLVPATLMALLMVMGLVVVGDFGPRAVGLWKGERIGQALIRGAAASLQVLAPLIVTAGVVDRAFAEMFGVAGARRQTRDAAGRDMLLGVFALADTMVAEVMTPRVDIIALDRSASFEEATQQVAAAEYSRLPVHDGDIDHIIGVLYAKSLLEGQFGAGAARDWVALVHPVEVVPEVKTLDQQLRDFQRGPSHMAIVVDEFGGTAGLVTLEDVLEEIVGEIGDEYDAPLGEPVQEASLGVYVVQGGAPLDELSTRLETAFSGDGVTTAGGLVVAALGHVPVMGETATVTGWKVTVERVEKRRVARMRFERLAPGPDGEAGA